MDHRTRPVVIPEELDLSGIDRTLGGSIWSLPPEHPISRERAESDLFPRFLLCYAWGPHLTAAVASVLDLTPYAAITEPPVRRALATAALPCLSAAPPQPSSPRRRCPAPPPPHRRVRKPPARLPCPRRCFPCTARTCAVLYAGLGRRSPTPSLTAVTHSRAAVVPCLRLPPEPPQQRSLSPPHR